MQYLQSSYYFDYEHTDIQKIISEFDKNNLSQKDITIALYKKVRDHWKYNPYSISFTKKNYKASNLSRKITGNCVEKSIILIACLRAMGIPARLHLGKVKNHIAVDRLTEKFGTNELTPHGMVNVFINNKWLKLSPAFNKSLCHILKVDPLEFDGESNSFLQQFNNEGTLFMEYVDDYGHFEDVPLDFMVKNLKENYPTIFDSKNDVTEYNL